MRDLCFVFDLFLATPSVVGGVGGAGFVGGIVFAIYVSYLYRILQFLRWLVVLVVVLTSRVLTCFDLFLTVPAVVVGAGCAGFAGGVGFLGGLVFAVYVCV